MSYIGMWSISEILATSIDTRKLFSCLVRPSLNIRVGHWTIAAAVETWIRRCRDCRVKFKISVSNSLQLELFDINVRPMHTTPTSNVHPLLPHSQSIYLLESILDKKKLNGHLNNLLMRMFVPT